MVPAPRRLFVVRCIRTSGITPSYLRFRSRQGALRTCERCDYVGVLLRPHTPSSMDTWIRTPRGSCLVSMRCGHGCHVASAGARACVRALARVCCMCNLAPAPSVTRIKLCSSRSRRDMTPAQRGLQKNGHNVGAIGACAMTWSGMPLSRGSGHFCTCGADWQVKPHCRPSEVANGPWADAAGSKRRGSPRPRGVAEIVYGNRGVFDK